MFGSATGSDESRDEERIRAQMIIDVEAFGKDARQLGIEPKNYDSYKLLEESVQSIDGELHR